MSGSPNGRSHVGPEWMTLKKKKKKEEEEEEEEEDETRGAGPSSGR